MGRERDNDNGSRSRIPEAGRQQTSTGNGTGSAAPSPGAAPVSNRAMVQYLQSVSSPNASGDVGAEGLTAEQELTGGSYHTSTVTPYGPPSHAKGYLGEVEATHILGRKYGMENVILAPKGAVNQGGIDMVVYDAARDKVLFVDNKAMKSAYIHNATALTDNLAQNTVKARAQIDALTSIDPVLKDKVLSAIDQKRIELTVTTSYGNGAILGPKLKNAGAVLEKLALDPLPASAASSAVVSSAASAGTESSPAPITASETQQQRMGGPDSEAPDRTASRRRTTNATTAAPEVSTEEPGNMRRKASAAAGESALYDRPFGNTSTIIQGAALDLALGVAQNLFNDWYKGYMKRQLANMKMPTLDRRLASGYLTDPKTSESMNVLQLFRKELPAFGKQLQEQHLDIVSSQYMETIRALGSYSKSEDRVFSLEEAAARLDDHETKLRTVRNNLEAALEYEESALAAARGAEELVPYINASQGHMVTYQLYTPDDVLKMMSNLRLYARTIREGFANVHALLAIIEPLLEESYNVSHQVNQLYWKEALGSAKAKSR
ncbi:hypothetical protein PCCS19_11750 [Paenibacillus sp. CCS19]|uniref:hypothetical protein n=1 Tax=Paenibacillus sp. CCS19 TaxID=3158387 RepID=UPI0025621A55|nr:hypothetical protein [Paenibacillus cellulosilyticus]GMK38121.1 hypothetical protein PCCS19_11750 [Paenibacillus cellulosilyticus]